MLRAYSIWRYDGGLELCVLDHVGAGADHDGDGPGARWARALRTGQEVTFLAGEARTIQLLRRHLVAERGWPRQAVRMKPFWTPGRRGLD